MSFTVSGFDVSTQGFERLRSYSEIILCAYIDSETDGASVLEQWLDDIQACDRPDGFDYAGAENAVLQFYAESFSMPKDLPAPSEGGDSSDGDVIAFLYLKDEREGAHYPVY